MAPGEGNVSGVPAAVTGFPRASVFTVVVALAHCSVLNRFFISTMNSSFVLTVTGNSREYRRSTLYRAGRLYELRVTPMGRSAPIASLFNSRLLRSVTGMRLANCNAMPNRLLLGVVPGE